MKEPSISKVLIVTVMGKWLTIMGKWKVEGNSRLSLLSEQSLLLSNSLCLLDTPYKTRGVVFRLCQHFVQSEINTHSKN